MCLKNEVIIQDSASRQPLTAVWLGQVEYAAAWELQRELVKMRAESQIPDMLLLLEHQRTITIGRRSQESHLLYSRQELLRRGFAIYDVDRGGEVTYHGPGQLVGYPILDLNGHKRDLHLYIRKLEEALISVLTPLEIRGIRNPPHTGVWVQDRKIAAIGVKVSRWVTSHGFALNVSTELDDFQVIVPCGIRDCAVTSVMRELGVSLRMEEMIPWVVAGFDTVFGFRSEGFHPEEFSDIYAGSPPFSDGSTKILSRAIDARKIGVIDYAPLCGRSHSSESKTGEI